MNLVRAINRRLQCKKGIVASVSLMLFAFVLVGTAFAEQIKIIDQEGKTKSMAELSSGSEASVKVSLATSGEKTSKLGDITVSLLSENGTEALQETKSTSEGIANFSNVGSGTYKLKVEEQGISIAEVSISDSTSSKQGAALSSEEDKKRSLARAMYLGGAGALASAVAIPIAINNDSSSGGSRSASAETSSLANVSGATASVSGGSSSSAATGAAAGGEVAALSAPRVQALGSPSPTISTISPPPEVPVIGTPPEVPSIGGPPPGEEGDVVTIPAAPAPPAPSPPPPSASQ